MLLFITADGEALTQARAVGPTSNVRAATLEVDLARPWRVGNEVERSASPLLLILGLDGSDTRLLELAFGAGADWLKGLRDEASGSEVCEAVAGAVTANAKRIDALRRSVELSETSPPSVAEKVRSALANLTADVRIVPGLDHVTGAWVETYEADDPIALAAIELLVRERRGDQLAVCGLCGCPFVTVNRIDELYCRRSAPGEALGGRTCHQLGPQRRYAAELGGHEAAYRTEYKRLDKWARRGAIDRTQLDQWRTRARAALEQGRHRRWTLDRFKRELAALEPERKDR